MGEGGLELHHGWDKKEVERRISISNVMLLPLRMLPLSVVLIFLGF